MSTVPLEVPEEVAARFAVLPDEERRRLAQVFIDGVTAPPDDPKRQLEQIEVDTKRAELDLKKAELRTKLLTQCLTPVVTIVAALITGSFALRQLREGGTLNVSTQERAASITAATSEFNAQSKADQERRAQILGSLKALGVAAAEMRQYMLRDINDPAEKREFLARRDAFVRTWVASSYDLYSFRTSLDDENAFDRLQRAYNVFLNAIVFKESGRQKDSSEFQGLKGTWREALEYECARPRKGGSANLLSFKQDGVFVAYDPAKASGGPPWDQFPIVPESQAYVDQSESLLRQQIGYYENQVRADGRSKPQFSEIYKGIRDSVMRASEPPPEKAIRVGP
jgi:hypothetical protein